MTLGNWTITRMATAAMIAAVLGAELAAAQTPADHNAGARSDTNTQPVALPKTEMLHARAVQLESFKRSQTGSSGQVGTANSSPALPAGMYSFVFRGTGRPGVVDIEILDGAGTVVDRTSGRLSGPGGEGRPREGTGQRQWRPGNFKLLGFTDNGNVLITKLENVTKLTLAGDKGWNIVTLLRPNREPPRRRR